MKLKGLKQLIKEEISKAFLDEKLGVPDNIITTATQVFDEYFEYVKDLSSDDAEDYFGSDSAGDLDGKSTIISNRGKGFDIADLHIRKIELTTSIIPHSKIELAGMGIPSILKFTPNSNLKMLPPKDKQAFELTEISIRLAMPPDTSMEDLLLFLLAEKPEMISSFAHELKHWYDGYKQVGGSTAQDRAKYAMSTRGNFGDIKPLNDFIFNLYFISGVESTVRSSELAADMKTKGITKKEFYDFLTQSRVFNKLRDIRDWTYDGFRNELKNYTSQIKSLLRYAGVPTRGLSEEELIDQILRLVLVNVTNWHGGELKQIVSNPQSLRDLLLMATGQAAPISKDDEAAFNKQINLITRFDEDYERYFKYNEKLFHKLGDSATKKVSKIYGLLPDEEKLTETNIVNREIWYKTYGYKGKLDTKLKRPKLK